MLQKNPILQSIGNWFARTFSDPDAITLFLTIVFAVVFLELFGTILLPVLVSVIIAYLLYPMLHAMRRWGCPQMVAVLLIFTLFMGSFGYGLFVLVPILAKQLTSVVHGLPDMFNLARGWLEQVMLRYPKYLSPDQIKTYTGALQNHVAAGGQVLLKYSLASIPNIIHLALYVILIPLFVFFFMKDSDQILKWFAQYQPRNRGLTLHVWHELNQKIGAYVKGRVFEIILIALVASIMFKLFGMKYAILLGVAVGVSVIIPYVGAVVVTIPVVVMALMQFGLSPHFFYILLAYIILIFVDGNLLVPILFSESMDLHPLVIILSVVIFGGIWGFWGVFFAIPLATLIDVVLRAWPRSFPNI
jgi:putative permease